jgi:hypothetical protein
MSDAFSRFKLAARDGQTDVFRQLLQRVNPQLNDNYAIRVACENGHTDIVRMLLETRKVDLSTVDPSAKDNYAIRKACENGHTEIVKMLLLEGVDPSAQNNYALRLACENGHTKIVRMLLNSEKVDPSTQNNDPLRLAFMYGHTKIVKMLLKTGKVDINAIADEDIEMACSELDKNVFLALITFTLETALVRNRIYGKEGKESQMLKLAISFINPKTSCEYIIDLFNEIKTGKVKKANLGGLADLVEGLAGLDVLEVNDPGFVRALKDNLGKFRTKSITKKLKKSKRKSLTNKKSKRKSIRIKLKKN